jgi:hypothetical protein
MNKLIAVFLVLLVASSFLLFGCTSGGTDTNTQVKITTADQANKTVGDVSSDISGISNSLDQIDQTLTDTNTP